MTWCLAPKRQPEATGGTDGSPPVGEVLATQKAPADRAQARSGGDPRGSWRRRAEERDRPEAPGPPQEGQRNEKKATHRTRSVWIPQVHEDEDAGDHRNQPDGQERGDETRLDNLALIGIHVITIVGS